MKTLVLVLKHKWYDMIDSGVKKEEYRKIKPYWEERLLDYKTLSRYVEDNRTKLRVMQLLFPHRPAIDDVCGQFPRGYTHVRFHRGYTPVSMTFAVKEITVGMGNPAWGAPDGEPVFIIRLGERSDGGEAHP